MIIASNKNLSFSNQLRKTVHSVSEQFSIGIHNTKHLINEKNPTLLTTTDNHWQSFVEKVFWVNKYLLVVWLQHILQTIESNQNPEQRILKKKKSCKKDV